MVLLNRAKVALRLMEILELEKSYRYPRKKLIKAINRLLNDIHKDV